MQDYINQKIENGQILTLQVMPSNVDPVGKDSCTSSLECSLTLQSLSIRQQLITNIPDKRCHCRSVVFVTQLTSKFNQVVFNILFLLPVQASVFRYTSLKVYLSGDSMSALCYIVLNSVPTSGSF